MKPKLLHNQRQSDSILLSLVSNNYS